MPRWATTVGLWGRLGPGSGSSGRFRGLGCRAGLPLWGCGGGWGPGVVGQRAIGGSDGPLGYQFLVLGAAARRWLAHSLQAWPVDRRNRAAPPLRQAPVSSQFRWVWADVRKGSENRQRAVRRDEPTPGPRQRS